MTPDPRFLNPGDHVIVSQSNGATRVWKVMSVHLGGEGQESVYGIRVIDRGYPFDGFGLRISVMYVPTILLEQFAQFAQVKRA